MFAVYFTVFPDEAQRILILSSHMKMSIMSGLKYNDTEEDQDNYKRSLRVIEYICKMKKSELEQALLQVLF